MAMTLAAHEGDQTLASGDLAADVARKVATLGGEQIRVLLRRTAGERSCVPGNETLDVGPIPIGERRRTSLRDRQRGPPNHRDHEGRAEHSANPHGTLLPTSSPPFSTG